jgi:hypothetical protein
MRGCGLDVQHNDIHRRQLLQDGRRFVPIRWAAPRAPSLPRLEVLLVDLQRLDLRLQRR